eukprot:2877551-Amphidinium_carterae.1
MSSNNSCLDLQQLFGQECSQFCCVVYIIVAPEDEDKRRRSSLEEPLLDASLGDHWGEEETIDWDKFTPHAAEE